MTMNKHIYLIIALLFVNIHIHAQDVDPMIQTQWGLCIPADTRSPIPVIPVHSVGNLQYMWQS